MVSTYILKKPKQDRSQRALQRIIAQAIVVIEKRGPNALTTADLAKRARVNISTLYKYFKNREAVIRHIGIQYSDIQTDRLRESIASLPDTTPWSLVFNRLIETMVDSWAKLPGFVQLQRYYLIDPKLHEVYRKSSLDVADALDKFRVAWKFRGTDAQWRLIHVVFGECATALLDLALDGKEFDCEDVLVELRRLSLAYYGVYFNSKPA